MKGGNGKWEMKENRKRKNGDRRKENEEEKRKNVLQPHRLQRLFKIIPARAQQN